MPSAGPGSTTNPAPITASPRSGLVQQDAGDELPPCLSARSVVAARTRRSRTTLRFRRQSLSFSLGNMNAPLPVRAKLIAAASSLVLLCAFSILHDIQTHSTGEVFFRICCVALATLLAFGGVFGNAQLQVLWGWGLAVAAPALAALCVFKLRGPDMLLGFIGTVVAVAGGYLLLIDSNVKLYRESLKRRPPA